MTIYLCPVHVAAVPCRICDHPPPAPVMPRPRPRVRAILRRRGRAL